jgi:hypothetical protein
MSDANAAVSAHRGIRGSHDQRRLTAHWPASKPAPEVAPAAPIQIEITGRALAEIFDYNDLWRSVRDRVEAMGISRLEFDHLTGLQDGYSGKLLGEAQRRRFGKESLGATLGGIGCRLVLVEDSAATAKIMARVKKRKLPRQLKLLPPTSSPADDSAQEHL